MQIETKKYMQTLLLLTYIFHCNPKMAKTSPQVIFVDTIVWNETDEQEPKNPYKIKKKSEKAKNYEQSKDVLYVNSTTKCESSGPYPRKAFVYLSSGISRLRKSFMPRHSV